MKFKRTGNIILLLGLLLSIIGLVYKLGYVNSVFFQYCFGIGILLFGFGVFLSGFNSKKED